LGSPPGDLLAGEIGVLKKLDRELALLPEASSLLAGKVRQSEALLYYIRGKKSLLANDSQKTYDFLSRAHALSPTMKLRILLAGLRSMPRLTLRAAHMWYRLEKEWTERPLDGEKSSPSTRGSMTVLRCLKCGEKLDCGPEQCVCHGCGAAWPVSDGIPRFFQAHDHYWGEVGRKEALELLEAAHRGSWADAVRTHFPKDDNMRFGLLDLQRASWAPMLGLDEQSTVLDIGSGYGAITHSLSRFAGEVYSIEAIPDRIDFTRERLRQEGILNVHLIQASATALPLAEKSFDLVVVNGVLEWVGDWDLAVHPRMAQINFLRKIHGLLKNDGVLLIGIENRFGLSSFLGNRDHSGLPYTSLVPRAVATFMLRHSSSRHYRTQKNTPKQYRTYTYSERGLRNLLSDAGFAELSSYWADPGYNQPYDLVPLAVPAWVRQHSVELLHHPGLPPRRSWKRRARKIAVPFFQPFVSDFVLLASKQSGRSTKLQRWIEQCLMESDRTRADQASRPRPIAWALHTRPFKESSIVRIGDARTGSDLAYLKVFVGTQEREPPLETEAMNRSKVQESLNASTAEFLRVPRFCGTLRIGATSYYMEEASRGSQISGRVRELGYFNNLKRVERDFSQICERILELTLALQHVSGVQTIPPAWREIPEISAGRPELTSALAERRYFQQRFPEPSATWIQHGDLSVENAHIDRKTGEFEVFDWCDLAGGLPPLYDFFQFFLSTGYLPRAAESVSFASEEDLWIATFNALFFSDAAIGRLTRRLILNAGERLKISADKIPSLLLEFLIIRSNYYQMRSPLQRRAQLRLLELCITDFEPLQLAWEPRSSPQALR
jgi:SAM-dependent methyltransferase